MKQKRSTIGAAFLLSFGINTLIAQDAVPATGGDAGGSGGTAAYSVGQVVYTGNSSVSGTSNQGVQQPYEFFITGINTAVTIDLSLSVYPNPATSFIDLKIDKADLADLSYQLFDVQGKLIVSTMIKSAETSIVMNDYQSGSYYLKVMDKDKELKTFKIIKN